MHAGAAGARDGLRGRQLVLLGVLDGDTIVRARKGAGVVGLVLVLVGGLGAARGVVDGRGAGEGVVAVVAVVAGVGVLEEARNLTVAAAGRAENGGGGAVERHLGLQLMLINDLFVGGEW